MRHNRINELQKEEKGFIDKKEKKQNFANKKAIIFSRVSTSKQKTERQILQNREYMIAQGFQYDNLIELDFTQSGYKKLIDNNSLKELKREIETNNIKYICVNELSRLTRDIQSFFNIIDYFKENKCNLFVVQENSFISYKDLYQESVIIKQTVDIINSHLEGYRLSLRALSGRKNRFLRSSVVGKSPFGYLNTHNDIVINKREADIIKFIYNERYKGVTLTEIKRELEYYYKLKIGLSRITNILSNSTYIGEEKPVKLLKNKIGDECEYEYYTRSLPQIIEPSLFYQIQDNKKKYNREAKRNITDCLLRLKIVCGNCGKKYSTSIRNKQYTPILDCNCKYKAIGDKQAKKITFDIEKLDTILWEVLSRYLTKYLKKETKKENENRKINTQKRIVEVKSELEEINKAKHKLNLKLDNDTIEVKEFRKKSASYKKLQNNLSNELKELEKRLRLFEEEDDTILDLMQNIFGNLEGAELYQTRERLRKSGIKEKIFFCKKYIKEIQVLEKTSFDFCYFVEEEFFDDEFQCYDFIDIPIELKNKTAIKIKVIFYDFVDNKEVEQIIYIKHKGGGVNGNSFYLYQYKNGIGYKIDSKDKLNHIIEQEKERAEINKDLLPLTKQELTEKKKKDKAKQKEKKEKNKAKLKELRANKKGS